MALEARINNPTDTRLLLEPRREFVSGAALRLIAHEIRFQAALHQKRGMRVQRATDEHGFGPQFLHHSGRADDCAGQHVTVATRILRERMNEQVHRVLAVLVEPGKRVVHDRKRTVLAAQGADALHIRDAQHGVGGAFKLHQLHGARRQNRLERRVVAHRQ